MPAGRIWVFTWIFCDRFWSSDSSSRWSTICAGSLACSPRGVCLPDISPCRWTGLPSFLPVHMEGSETVRSAASASSVSSGNAA
jgi:hypothetical protein